MKLDQLTFTRFIAAIAIVVFHFGMNAAPFTSQIFKEIFSNAALSVSYFFVLSGFVMIIAYSSKGIKIKLNNYYVNRIARIFPIYITALIVTVILVGRGIFNFTGLHIYTLLSNILLLQEWIPKYASSINFPGWSLSVELLFYLLFPLLFNHIYRKYNLKTVAIFILCVWFSSQLLVNILDHQIFFITNQTAKHFLFYYPFLHLNSFMVGNLTGFIFFKLRNKFRNYDIQLLIISSIILVVFYFRIPFFLHDGLYAIFFVPFILLLSLNNGVITSVFSKTVFVVLGEVSYSIYILQLPVYLLFSIATKHLHILINETVSFFTYLVILLIASFIGYYLVEIPARNFIRTWFEERNRKHYSFAREK